MAASSPATARLDALVGQLLDGRFRVLDLLGQGGMGAVFRAHQVSTSREVALKVIKADTADDPRAVQRFLREAIAASRLANPHTITVFDFGETPDGMVYIAMELLRGRSLAQVLKDQRGPVDPARAVNIVQQILESLGEAHDAGVLHRDLKPENVFLVEGPRTKDFVKVLDFGVAKLTDPHAESLTTTGMVYGTPVYMSPEQAQAQDLDGRCDLYSVGVMLFEMLSGRVPFDAPTPMALLVQKSYEKAPAIGHVNPSVHVPPALEAVVASLLEADRAQRPASAVEASARLARAMGGPAVAGDKGRPGRETAPLGTPATGGTGAATVLMAAPPVAPDREVLDTTLRLPAAKRRRAAWVAGALVLAALAAALSAWALAGRDGGAPEAPEAPAEAKAAPAEAQAAPAEVQAAAPAEAPPEARNVPAASPAPAADAAAEAPARAATTGNAPAAPAAKTDRPPAGAPKAAPRRRDDGTKKAAPEADLEMLRMLRHREAGGN
jgi:eukaryotic-like serine/threonine-protein kinase